MSLGQIMAMYLRGMTRRYRWLEVQLPNLSSRGMLRLPERMTLSNGRARNLANDDLVSFP